MKMPITDTNTKMQHILIEGYRKMTPQQKMRRVSELIKSIQQLALARICQQYGNISERDQMLRLASLWLDRETMIKAFGWDPQIKGF
jgi:hypothetical protein